MSLYNEETPGFKFLRDYLHMDYENTESLACRVAERAETVISDKDARIQQLEAEVARLIPISADRKDWQDVAMKTVAERDKLLADLAAARLDSARLEALYHGLLFAVGMKHEGETRHETALRYIRQAEQCSSEADTARAPEGKK